MLELQNSRLKWTFASGKVLYVELAKVEGYDWGVLRVLNAAGEAVANAGHIKPGSDELALQLLNVGGAADDLVLDPDNGHWTSTE